VKKTDGQSEVGVDVIVRCSFVLLVCNAFNWRRNEAGRFPFETRKLLCMLIKFLANVFYSVSEFCVFNCDSFMLRCQDEQ